MSSISTPQGRKQIYVPPTKISSYDQVSSLLVALTVLIGTMCFVLFMIWLTTIVRLPPSQAAVEFNDELMGNNNNPEGIAEDFEEPGVEELADVPEPQLADAIEAVTDAVSTQQAHLEATEGNAAQQGSGSGLGDYRDPGPGNGGDRVDKPWERWEILYSTANQQEYGSQLSHFGIELGAISKSTPTIRYLRGVGVGTPEQRGGTKSQERRIFFSYRDGSKLKAWDQQFFQSVGLDTNEYVLVQFYPSETQRQLLSLERQAIGAGTSIADVKRTRFGVRPTSDGYEYYVIDYAMK